MGRSYYTSGASGPSITSFRERTYTLNGAVLAVTGVADHEAFVRMVEDEFPAPAPGTEAALNAFDNASTVAIASPGAPPP